MTTQKTPVDMNRCIILPFQPMLGRSFDGVGLALHFLLGNVMVLHNGLKELWFGWRIKKIYQNAAELSAYCRGTQISTPLKDLSRQQKVRFWAHGRNNHTNVSIELYDGRRSTAMVSDNLKISLDNYLVDFRRCFIELFDQSDLPFSNDQKQAALWEERVPMQGLDAIGRALEYFYRYSAFPPLQKPLELSPFEMAVAQAPDSFMAHDLMGWAHYRRHNYSIAQDAFSRALSLNPNGAGAMAGLVGCGVHTRNWEETRHWALRKADACAEDTAQAEEKARRRFNNFSR